MVKPMFNGQEEVLMQTPQVTGLGDLNDYDIGLEDSVHCVPVEKMRSEVFKPVISDVLDLIQKQLHQSQVYSATFMDSRLVWMSVSKEYVTWSYPKGLGSPLYVCNSPKQPKYIADPGVQKIADFYIPENPGAQSPRTRVVFRLNQKVFFVQDAVF
ncbi:MAG: hypothetical protein J3Q66DRAFT_369425 [Benniella sp.]|nr:MAG: hypothetical protein J3Q66DRAFT_369425 [Benniella sp.]